MQGDIAVSIVSPTGIITHYNSHYDVVLFPFARETLCSSEKIRENYHRIIILLKYNPSVIYSFFGFDGLNEEMFFI